jgi:diadenosine tetraphosphate (Ap4A) HIT family hydrolase
MHAFQLHPRLAEDTQVVGDLPLCRLLLMNDRRFPWCILVPRQAGLRELHDLSAGDLADLMSEVVTASRALQNHCKAFKINVGALGNLVPQLHVHVVGRREDDDAWPGPVWGHGQASPYEETEAARLRKALWEACSLTSAR